MGTVTIQDITPKKPITMIGRQAGVCWNANIEDDANNYRRGLDCIKSQHGRTWEFPDVYSVIDGYSAKVIREWYTSIGCLPTRLQSSTRYINYSNINSDGFEYVTPPKIKSNQDALEEWDHFMKHANALISRMINDYDIPVEDATNILPLAYSTKIVDKRNFRNLVDMSHQRKCNRAYWEYRQLFSDYENALRNYSEEWNTLCDLFEPKCELYGYCNEKKSCGRKPRKGDVDVD